MDFNLLDTYVWMAKLKCTVCQNLLSHFPIYLSANNENVCGRCLEDAKVGAYTRNDIFEIVAQDIPFACRYRTEGCIEKLPPKYIPEHEDKCPYRTVTCPMKNLVGCEDLISNLNWNDHCRTKHASIFLQKGAFKVNVGKFRKCYNLMENNNQIFIVSTHFKENNVLNFSLTRRDVYGTYCVPSYELTFTCGHAKFSLKCLDDVTTYNKNISLNSLLTSSKSSAVEGKIDIDSTQANSRGEDFSAMLLQLFQCQNCLAPLLVSKSNCAKCGHYDSTFQSSCEKLAKSVNFPCQNSKNGCAFMGNPDELKMHFESCSFAKRNCLISDYTQCGWNGFDKDLRTHLITDHRDILVQNYCISINITNLNRQNHFIKHHRLYNASYQSGVEKCYILRFANYFFKLVFLMVNQKCYWIMQMIGKFEDIFKYEIELVENKINVKLILSQNCYEDCNRQNLLRDIHKYCYFPSDQLGKFITQINKITFNVRIIKKNELIDKEK